MLEKDKVALRDASPYNAAITREQFLFYEVRTTAKLVCEGLGNDEIVDRIVKENLFQYPTEKSVKKMALACLRRLNALEDSTLVQAIVTQPSDVSKQICLYAMMRQYRLVWEFMLTVVGSKYRLLDTSFGKIDLNGFFMRLQEQDDWVATWSDSTITKLKQVLQKILVENEYLDSTDADHLNPVLISPLLENAIRASGQELALPLRVVLHDVHDDGRAQQDQVVVVVLLQKARRGNAHDGKEHRVIVEEDVFLPAQKHLAGLQRLFREDVHHAELRRLPHPVADAGAGAVLPQQLAQRLQRERRRVGKAVVGVDDDRITVIDRDVVLGKERGQLRAHQHVVHRAARHVRRLHADDAVRAAHVLREGVHHRVRLEIAGDALLDDRGEAAVDPVRLQAVRPLLLGDELRRGVVERQERAVQRDQVDAHAAGQLSRQRPGAEHRAPAGGRAGREDLLRRRDIQQIQHVPAQRGGLRQKQDALRHADLLFGDPAAQNHAGQHRAKVRQQHKPSLPILCFRVYIVIISIFPRFVQQI